MADDIATEAAAILRGRLLPVHCRALRKAVAEADAVLAQTDNVAGLPRATLERNRALWRAVREQAQARLRKTEGAL